tara:strand:- start:501 stop:1343 length:843 start_codon:yes stop_codon:yes gene_type:complete
VKIAIIFFGLPRQYQFTSKYITIDELYDVDYFGHAWNVNDKLTSSQEIEKKLVDTYNGIFQVNNYTQEFKRISNLYKKTALIKNDYIFDVIRKGEDINQWRSFEKGVKNINNNYYDLVIVTRYDAISEILFQKEKLKEIHDFIIKNPGIINISRTNLGGTHYPSLDDFIFVGDINSIKKFAKNFTKNQIYRLYLEVLDPQYDNLLEELIIKQLTTTQKQWRNMWLEKTIVDNIDVYYKDIPTYIYRASCPIQPKTKKAPTPSEIEIIYEFGEEFLRKLHA